MTPIIAKFRSVCHGCKDVVLPGTPVLYDAVIKKVFHEGCRPAEQPELPTGEADELADRLGFEKRDK